MEKIFTLTEIEELKNNTRKAIEEAICEATKDEAKTARELADAIGLCSAQHITNTMCGGYRFKGYRGKYNTSYFSIVHKVVTKVHHFAELDDNGNIIRYFDKEKTYKVNAYKVE